MPAPRGCRLVDEIFVELNNTLIATKVAVDSKLTVLPSYIELPTISVNALCQNIWMTRSNVTILVESLESTEDFYCRSAVTACSKTGICLIGIDTVLHNDRTTLLPFQFAGNKCSSENENMSKIMESKGVLGSIETYIPSVFL